MDLRASNISRVCSRRKISRVCYKIRKISRIPWSMEFHLSIPVSTRGHLTHTTITEHPCGHMSHVLRTPVPPALPLAGRTRTRAVRRSVQLMPHPRRQPLHAAPHRGRRVCAHPHTSHHRPSRRHFAHFAHLLSLKHFVMLASFRACTPAWPCR